MSFERKGECNHCGYCCLFIATEPHVLSFDRSNLRDKNGEFDEAHAHVRGLVHAANSPNPNELNVPAWFYSPCQAYNMDTLRCSIQAEKPRICQDFPWIPEQIVGTPCSYYFEKTNEAGVIFRQGGQGSPHPGRSAEQHGTKLLDADPYFNVPYPLIMPRRPDHA